MPRKTNARKTNGTKAHEVGADNSTLYSRTQASAYLGVAVSTLRLWQASGRFEPSRQRKGVWLYERKHLDECARTLRTSNGELAREVFGRLEQGRTAVQIVMELAADPEQVAQLVDSYARLTGSWLVAGPPGPRRAWEDTYRVGELTPTKLRRALELVAATPELRAKLDG